MARWSRKSNNSEDCDLCSQKLKQLSFKILRKFAYSRAMRKIATTLLFGAFTSLLVYRSASHLLGWYLTGQLGAHKKPVLDGLQVLTYSSDPIRFTIEFDLYLFLLTMGVLGVLTTIRDVLLEVAGPPYLVDLQKTYELVMRIYWLFASSLLIIALFNKIG